MKVHNVVRVLKICGKFGNNNLGVIVRKYEEEYLPWKYQVQLISNRSHEDFFWQISNKGPIPGARFLCHEKELELIDAN